MLTTQRLTMPSITPNLRKNLNVVTLLRRWGNSIPCNDQRRAQVPPMKASGVDHYYCGGGTHPQGPSWLLDQFCCEWFGAFTQPAPQ